MDLASVSFFGVLRHARPTVRIAIVLTVLCSVGSVVSGCGARSMRGRVQLSNGQVQERRLDRYQEAALTRAAADIPCAESQLVVENLRDNGYRIRGCGRWVAYTCASSAGAWRVGCEPAGSGPLAETPSPFAPPE